MATRMPSSSGALLASLLPLLEALTVVAAADADRGVAAFVDDIDLLESDFTNNDHFGRKVPRYVRTDHQGNDDWG